MPIRRRKLLLAGSLNSDKDSPESKPASNFGRATVLFRFGTYCILLGWTSTSLTAKLDQHWGTTTTFEPSFSSIPTTVQFIPSDTVVRSHYVSPGWRRNLSPIDPRDVTTPDYNGLTVPMQRTRGEKYNDDDESRFEHERQAAMEKMDVPLGLRPIKYVPADDCAPPAWTKLDFPTCNLFHEKMELGAPPNGTDALSVKIIGSGYKRDAFLFENYAVQEEFVLKRANQNTFNFSPRDMDPARREALILERLQAANRISVIYGYCATSVAVEALSNELKDQILPYTDHHTERGRLAPEILQALQQQSDSREAFSLNNFTVEEKLHLAIGMAEGLAELHGYHESPVAHFDVHHGQFLTNAAGDVILNDLNSAVFLQYSPSMAEYCGVVRKSRFGPFKSPEDIDSDVANVASDVWALGVLIFVLLTGTMFGR